MSDETEYQFDVGDMVRDLANQLSEKSVECAQLRAIVRKLSASAESETVAAGGE